MLQNAITGILTYEASVTGYKKKKTLRQPQQTGINENTWYTEMKSFIAISTKLLGLAYPFTQN